MSKHETWRTKEYWRQVGGTLVLEFQAIQQRRGRNGKRLLDGVIIKNGIDQIVGSGSASFEGEDITVIQTKGSRLGMYLMGQAFFSREIMRRYNPRSIETVAICAQGDAEMEALCTQFDIKVEIIPDGTGTEIVE